MGEVTEMFDVEPTVIRYWCTQFSCLRPKRNGKGNRMFSRQDVERLKRIHHLLRERKMTIEGAQKAMRKRVIAAEENDSEMALLEQLQTLRAMLVEMRDCIGGDMPIEIATAEVEVAETVKAADVVEVASVDVAVEEVVAPEVVAVPETVAEEVSIEDIFAPKEVVVEEVAAPIDVVENVATLAEIAVEESVAQPAVDTLTEPKPKKKRAPRRKLIGEEGVVERPLFPFFEQTLF